MAAHGQTKSIAYADLLGFSELVVTDMDQAESLLSDFYKIAQELKNAERFDTLDLILVSDSLFAYGQDVSEVVNYACLLYRAALKYSGNSPHPMLLRGGVAAGEAIIQKGEQPPQVKTNLLLSPALVHAVKMEGLIKGHRLLIAANDREVLRHFWNKDIDSICYGQPSLKGDALFPGYKYQDLLWARKRDVYAFMRFWPMRM
jgi:hypothetical protein